MRIIASIEDLMVIEKILKLLQSGQGGARQASELPPSRAPSQVSIGPRTHRAWICRGGVENRCKGLYWACVCKSGQSLGFSANIGENHRDTALNG